MYGRFAISWWDSGIQGSQTNPPVTCYTILVNTFVMPNGLYHFGEHIRDAEWVAMHNGDAKRPFSGQSHPKNDSGLQPPMALAIATTLSIQGVLFLVSLEHSTYSLQNSYHGRSAQEATQKPSGHTKQT